MRTPGIPLWITIVTALLAIAGGLAGVAAVLGHGMEPFMNAAWGGRGLGLSVIAGFVIWMKNPLAYLALFIAAIIRELADLVQLSWAAEFDWSLGVPALILLIVWSVGIYYSVKAHGLS